MEKFNSWFGAVIGVCMLANTLAYAGPVEEGIMLYEKEQYKAAFPKLSVAAADNNSKAMTYLAGLYYYGLGGVPKDTVKGMALYRKAAAKNFALAEHNIADIYRYGTDAPKDLVKAVAWDKRSATHGYSSAFQMLASAYRFGDGVPKDLAESYYWDLLFRQSIANDIAKLEAIKKRTPDQEKSYTSSLSLRAMLNNSISPFPPTELTAVQRKTIEARAKAYRPQPNAVFPNI